MKKTKYEGAIQEYLQYLVYEGRDIAGVVITCGEGKVTIRITGRYSVKSDYYVSVLLNPDDDIPLEHVSLDEVGVNETMDVPIESIVDGKPEVGSTVRCLASKLDGVQLRYKAARDPGALVMEDDVYEYMRMYIFRRKEKDNNGVVIEGGCFMSVSLHITRRMALCLF